MAEFGGTKKVGVRYCGALGVLGVREKGVPFPKLVAEIGVCNGAPCVLTKFVVREGLWCSRKAERAALTPVVGGGGGGM